MPPKGPKIPASSHAKEQQNVSIEDLLFPRSTIVNLAKDTALVGADANAANEEEQKKVILSKDAVTALQRAATVFVNYLMLVSREGATSQIRKSCNVDDVLAALDYCGLEGLKAVVRARLDEYSRALELRKLKKQQETGSVPEAGPEADEPETQEDVEISEPIDTFAKKPRLEG
ncbi:LAME_0G08504g1_1 [Lachancea meyersii CBS 8951]|uniref:DNA polymerase epsilon subunit D n=1 Tax=Lachancea meyersii CBS 8951 TaxID=1266667 RepID=A0A1G4K8D1_9SACH|nr:LAME_0G08504g1_1 [Lachancea meyersii CBS 8951]